MLAQGGIPMPVQGGLPMQTHGGLPMQAYSQNNPSQIYTADPHWCDQVLKTRQKVSGICKQCMNRTVRIQTLDGHTYEGVIVGSDNCYLHLMTRDMRFFGPNASNAILTLVLYELLVITLLI